MFSSESFASPLQDLDLNRPVRGLRLPLVPKDSGTTAGLITAREIRLESQKVGPLRVRVLAGPVIEGMTLQLPQSADLRDMAWTEGLANFFVLGRYPVPLVINGLSIKCGVLHEIVRARRAIFDAATGRLEMQDATLLAGEGSPRIIGRIWLSLRGPHAGFLVWRVGRGSEVMAQHVLDPTAEPDDTDD